MKKVLSVVLAVMMLASLSVMAFADDAVNPSVTTKAAPEVDEESVEVEGLAEDAVVTVELTSAADAEDEETKAAVEAAVAAVTDQAALADAVASAVAVETTGTLATLDTSADAVPAVSDVFFVDVKDEDGNSVLASEYVEGEAPAVKVRVKVELPKNLMKVLQLVGDTWIEVPVVLNEDGEPVLELSYAGPIVFVVNSNVENG